MPIKRLPGEATSSARITAWSYSRLRDHRKCPQLARYKHVDKLKEPSSAPMEEGSYVDHLAEVWETDNADKPMPDASREPWAGSFIQRYAADQKRMRKGVIPAELARFPEEFAYLRSIKAQLHPQEQLAFTARWEDAGPRGWFDTSGRTRVRVKMDVWWDESPRRHIVDHKNGKIRDEDLEQLGLYALAALLTAPKSITEAEARLWYLQEGVILPEVPHIYTRAEVPELKKRWEKKAAPMLADKQFKPTPGRHCQWCFFSKEKGGPCAY